MNVFKRGMVFLTFISSCFGIALVVSSLGTKQWVNARAKRTSNPHESDGRIQFGLFDGKKELNVAYGWRTYEIDVIQLLKYEPEFLIYGYWLSTVLCICAAILFSGFAAVFAAINTATTTSRCLTGVSGLYLWNCLALLFQVGAIAFWLAQFFLRIQNSVLTREDKDNMWTSEGMADLGYSFWFVVGAAIASFINVIILMIANSDRDVDNIVPVLEEKTNGAIMLY